MSVAVKKSLLFIIESHPADSDRAVQAARMALSVAMEHHVVVAFAGDAVALCNQGFFDLDPAHPFFESERFLIEMEIPRFCIDAPAGWRLRTGITVLAGMADIDLRKFSGIFCL